MHCNYYIFLIVVSCVCHFDLVQLLIILQTCINQEFSAFDLFDRIDAKNTLNYVAMQYEWGQE